MKIILALLAAVVLGGCSVDDAVARSERALEAAQQAVADVEHSLAVAQATAEKLKTLAVSLDSATAANVVDQANRLVEQATAALPQVKHALNTATAANDAAVAAKNAGGGVWDMVLGAVGVLVPGASGAVVLLRSLGRMRTAVRVTAAHADRMETATTDEDVVRVKAMAALEQSALGVGDIIASIRGKKS